MKHVFTLLLLIFSVLLYAKEPSKKEVYDHIVCMQIKFPDIVLAQAILESGSFKSNLAKKNKNLFGMRLARIRSTTAKGQVHGYAKYDSWQESVKDYKLWQQHMMSKNPNMTRSQYMNLLNRIYSQTSSYAIRLKSIIKTNKNRYEENNPRTVDFCSANDSMWIRRF